MTFSGFMHPETGLVMFVLQWLVKWLSLQSVRFHCELVHCNFYLLWRRKSVNTVIKGIVETNHLRDQGKEQSPRYIIPFARVWNLQQFFWAEMSCASSYHDLARVLSSPFFEDWNVDRRLRRLLTVRQLSLSALHHLWPIHEWHSQYEACLAIARPKVWFFQNKDSHTK